jgi:signal peptidase II
MKRWFPAAIIIAAVAFLDQVTKSLVVKHYQIGESMSVIPGFFHITHIRNRGAVFGMFRDAGESFRYWFFCVATIPLVIVLLVIMRRLKDDQTITFYAMAFIVGGAVGNLIDRFRFGEVTDFLDFFIGRIHWPAFNVADAAISCGAVLILLLMMLPKAAATGE